MSSSSIFLTGSALFLATCIALTGCAGKPAEAPGAGPPTVTVSYPLQRDVTDYEVYTGRTAAVDSVQIRARVTGYLQKINFQDGEDVEDGKVLVEIDPRPYQATFDQALGQLNVNQAQLQLSRGNLKRGQDLAPGGGISKEELDQRRSNVQADEARVNVAQANLVTARLNLDWTKVTAPVSGQISYRLVTPGNLITADQTILTTIVSRDPMWVYFAMDEPTVVRIRELMRAGKIPLSASGKVARHTVSLALSGEKGFPHEGYVDFANNQLDQATATLLVRAVVPNPSPPIGDRVFAPAMFVRVRVPVTAPYSALLVSEAAVGTDQNLRYLYVVNEENKVVRHTVQLGTQQDGLQVIAEGLQPGERVIVNGLQKVHQGVVVSPKLVDMPIPAKGALPQTPPNVLTTPAPGPKR
jgi:membrane fusion protein, multidrug efflux system